MKIGIPFALALSQVFASCSNIEDSKLFFTPGDVTRFVDQGGDPNTRFCHFGNPKQEMSFLHFAVLKKDIRLVRKLLSAGANPNALDTNGKTPLMTIFSNFNEIDDMVEIIDALRPITNLSIKDKGGEDVFDLVRMFWGDKWDLYLRKNSP